MPRQFPGHPAGLWATLGKEKRPRLTDMGKLGEAMDTASNTLSNVCVERYVMSVEDQDALIGRVLRQKKDADRRLAMLLAEAKRIGENLRNLSALLTGNAQYIWFDGVSTNTGYRHPSADTFKLADIDGQKIAALTSQIRDAMDEQRRCCDEANKLGY